MDSKPPGLLRAFQSPQGEEAVSQKTYVEVLLECGCKVKVRVWPQMGRKFCCPGAGHGYNLDWKSYIRGEREYTNFKARQP